MEELPRGWKVPKFIKFGGETSESTVEHIARCLTEADAISNFSSIFDGKVRRRV